MRNLFLFLLVATLSLSASAQSGRRIKTPPPTPQTEPPVQEQAATETQSAPTTDRFSTLAGLSALPEGIRQHQMKSLDKGSFSLADFSGKVIVVNLWASWCGPCRMEVPEYEKVRKAYMGRGVEFIGLTVEDPRNSAERVKQFVRDFNFGFRLAWADREMALTLSEGRGTIPQTLVIATDGRILNHWRGYSPGHSGERLRQAIERALSGQTQSKP